MIKYRQFINNLEFFYFTAKYHIGKIFLVRSWKLMFAKFLYDSQNVMSAKYQKMVNSEK